MASLVAVPKRPEGVKLNVVRNFRESYVVANWYTSGQQRVLLNTIDDIETEVSFRAYDHMERRDPTIVKCKKILVTGVLADDLQLAPGATEAQVGQAEYETFTEIMEFCERVLHGLERPIRSTLEQIYGNGLKYGNGVAETVWDYRMDAPSTKPDESAKDVPSKSTGKLASLTTRFSAWWRGTKLESAAKTNTALKRPTLQNEKIRLMPVSIKVKPRDSIRFVVDDYMSLLGFVPARRGQLNLAIDQIIDRDKFMVLTLNKQDEDPRGNSSFRAAVNWYNLKTQLPSEILRFIIEESVPKAVATLAKDMAPFEFERDENGKVIYDANPVPGNDPIPRMITAAESFRKQIEGFRSGSGAVIPPETKLEPYKKGVTGANDADLFGKILKIVNDEMENSILLQTLAQSEGAHQARSASQQVAELLYNLVFWARWELSTMVLYDLFSVAVKINFGEWALRYLPLVSLGDFVRRDWVTELDTYANAYFKGLLDDTQRPEIMASLNLPKPGPSRQELGLNAQAQVDPTTGDPVMPNSNRPDKQPGTDKRNQGNGTEKKKNVKTTNAYSGFGPLNTLGNNPGWFGRFKSHIRTGR